MELLDQARAEINRVDREMAKLFEERMMAVRTVAQYKMERGLQIFDPSREQAVLDRCSGYLENEDMRSFYMHFVQDVMNVSKLYQHHLMEGLRVAYSGVQGAFAHIAAGKIFPDARLVSCTDFQAAYDEVVNGTCDCAVLPIENSFAGEVGQVMDLMFSGSLYITGVYSLRISQNLLGVKGARLEDIRRVTSHPQALAQCEGYLKSHGLESYPSVNTARAAQAVAEAGDIHLAAIASAETTELYHLEILDHDINESSQNTTRFAVFSRVPGSEAITPHNRFMLMFSVKNTAGSLVNALAVLGRHGFNMRALHSRPMRELAWQYYFYVEVDGDDSGENGKEMLRELEQHCEKLKIVGNYDTDTELGDK